MLSFALHATVNLRVLESIIDPRGVYVAGKSVQEREVQH
jgi:hypothetical protein